MFARACRYAEFDITELSFSSYMRMVDMGDSPYIAVPAFLSRAFRHSSFYIRTDRGIQSPADLAGRTIGVPEYQMTAALWLRGMLQEDYGVKPTDVHWRTGGQEQPGREERMPVDIAGLDLAADSRGQDALRNARGRRDRRHAVGTDALGLSAAGATRRPPFSQLQGGRAELLQEDGLFSDHAPRGLAQLAGAKISMAAGKHVQGSARVEGDRPGKTVQSRPARGCAAMDGSRGGGNQGAHGRGLLALRREGLPPRDRRDDTLCPRAGTDPAPAQRRRAVRTVDLRDGAD